MHDLKKELQRAKLLKDSSNDAYKIIHDYETKLKDREAGYIHSLPTELNLHKLSVKMG